jgi:hypothetical protein
MVVVVRASLVKLGRIGDTFEAGDCSVEIGDDDGMAEKKY